MAEIMEINRILKPYGLTIDDFKKLPKKDKEFWNEIIKILIAENDGINWNKIFNDINTKKINPETKNDAQMWAYAWEMAQLNKKRERNAKDIHQETKYMYMSHYIDLRTGVNYKVDKSISNDDYFSAWITDDDRRAYDDYLRDTKAASLFTTEAEIVTGLMSLYPVLVNNDALGKMKTARGRIANSFDAIGVYFTADSLNSSFMKMSDLLKEGNNPRLFVDNLKKAMQTEDYSKLQKDSIRNILLAICSAMFVEGALGVLLTIGLSMAVFTAYVIKDFYVRIRWLAMIRYNSMRVANRIIRHHSSLFRGIRYGVSE